jgi:hypothetical protein
MYSDLDETIEDPGIVVGARWSLAMWVLPTRWICQSDKSGVARRECQKRLVAGADDLMGTGSVEFSTDQSGMSGSAVPNEPSMRETMALVGQGV